LVPALLEGEWFSNLNLVSGGSKGKKEKRADRETVILRKNSLRGSWPNLNSSRRVGRRKSARRRGNKKTKVKKKLNKEWTPNKI